MVCLERDPVPSPRAWSIESPGRSEGDLVVDNCAVHGQHDWFVVVHETDPADGDTGDEAPTDGLLQIVVVDDEVRVAGGADRGVVRDCRCVHGPDC